MKDMLDRIVIVGIEPSTGLSEIFCDVLSVPHGFPYLIERRFTVRELLEKNLIDEEDIRQMEDGGQIKKSWRASQ